MEIRAVSPRLSALCRRTDWITIPSANHIYLAGALRCLAVEVEYMYRKRRSSFFDDATKLIFVASLALGLLLVWAVVGLSSFWLR